MKFVCITCRRPMSVLSRADLAFAGHHQHQDALQFNSVKAIFLTMFSWDEYWKMRNEIHC